MKPQQYFSILIHSHSYLLAVNTQITMATINWPSIQTKLPRVYEAVIDIYNHTTKPCSAKMQSAINNYSAALIKQWTKSFGAKHVLSLPTVKQKLKSHINTNFTTRCIYPHIGTLGRKRRLLQKNP